MDSEGQASNRIGKLPQKEEGEEEKEEDDDEEEEEEIVIFTGETRPGVITYQNASSFLPGDEVWFLQNGVRTGPYLVQEVVDGKYILCDSSYRTILDGKKFEEKELVLYDPFA